MLRFLMFLRRCIIGNCFFWFLLLIALSLHCYYSVTYYRVIELSLLKFIGNENFSFFL